VIQGASFSPEVSGLLTVLLYVPMFTKIEPLSSARQAYRVRHFLFQQPGVLTFLSEVNILKICSNPGSSLLKVSKLSG
jgi:hypothetical protein